MSLVLNSGFTIGPGVVLDAGYESPITPVTSNLLEHLDALDYTGSGSTWTARVGNNATLYNSPTYTSSGPTYFSFLPGNSQWANVPNLGSMSNWTVEAWFRIPDNGMSPYITAIVSNAWNYSTSLNYSIGTNNSPSNYNLAAGFFDGNWHSTNGFSPSANTWYHVVGTYDGSVLTQFVNAIGINTLTYTGTPTSGGDTRIASRWDNQNPPGDFFYGDIAVVRIYNTALDYTAVENNFNAERTRFGV